MLFFLTKKIELSHNCNVNYQMIVRVDENEGEKEARQIAAENAMDEGADCWLDNEKSSCNYLGEEGKRGLLINSSN